MGQSFLIEEMEKWKWIEIEDTSDERKEEESIRTEMEENQMDY